MSHVNDVVQVEFLENPEHVVGVAVQEIISAVVVVAQVGLACSNVVKQVDAKVSLEPGTLVRHISWLQPKP